MNYKNILLTIFFIFSYVPSLMSLEPIEEKPIVVVVVSYNNAKWVEQNLNSILDQNYTNYRVVYIDDCSKDNTGNLVEKYIANRDHDHRFTLVRNLERAGSPLANHYKAIHEYCENHEIVICLDGDDWFAHDGVLKIINKAYSKNDIWLTHGTIQEYHLDARNGTVGWSIPIPKSIVEANAFRSYRCPSHAKTFYAWLFKEIKLEDLLYNGKFFPASADQAMMFPMIEMAAERHAFISDIIYIYNMTNPLGLSIVSTQLQRDCEQYIRNLQPYSRLEAAPL